MNLSTSAAPSVPASPSLAERIDRQQLELVVAAVRRTPVPLLLMNLFAAWLVWRAGWPRLALAWFLVYCLMHALRWSWVRRWRDQPPADAHQALRRLSLVFVALGALLAAMALLVFASDATELHYTATALCVGVSAGAVVVSAWTPRVFAAWGLMVGGALVAGWIWHGNVLGLGLAVLVIALFWVLFSHSRDQRQALVQLVTLAAENERLVASLRGERDRAEAASQSKTRFFAAASHDLRQPLHALAINAYALAVLARRHGDAKILQLSDSIDRALRQSTSLLDGLLDVSRLDAGAVQPEIRDVDAVALLEGVRHEFAPLAAQRGLALALELPPQPRIGLRTDPDLLLRVLNNLVGNALKFTREGGVRISAAPDGASHVRLTVVDTGCGIAHDEQERVFEEFYQVANPSRDRGQGLGLGLAIVRRVASLLDIDVRLDSRPGHGTRVELCVPAAVTPPAAVAAPDDAPPLPGLKVLVIDDEAEVRASMLALIGALQGEGRAADGRDDAVALVSAGFAPDVIVADHRLRDQSGLDAVAAVRAVIGPKPVVVVTGDTAPQTLAQVQGSGYRVVHKPVDGATLARALRDAAAG